MTISRGQAAPPALVEWFGCQNIPFDGALRLGLIAGGRSNLTYEVSDQAGHHYILRRPPEGSLLHTAHDVAREYRLISSLAGSRVPVPPLRALCTDAAILGAPFYVMDFVDGVVLETDEDGEAYPATARWTAGIAVVDVLGTLHDVDVDAVGLGDLGRREDYAARQLRRWLRQFHDASVRDLPVIDEIHDRLSERVPPQRYTGLVHGDYRPGNVILNGLGAVQAVLDWELATLGDTLADVGWLTAFWREPGEPEIHPSPTAHPEYPSRADLLQRYQDVTGRDLSDIGWYHVFALWRMACIGEGVYARYRDGGMGADGFDVGHQGRAVLTLAEMAHERLQYMP